MVLFAALAMARFAESACRSCSASTAWFLANALAFAGAVAVMIAVAWLIEKLALSRLVNQEGIALLMATLGIAYFLDGFGQAVFGHDLYQFDVGLRKDPIVVLVGVFQGGTSSSTRRTCTRR